MSLLHAVPSIPDSATRDDFRSTYDSIQCVCFKKKTAEGKKRKRHQKPEDYLQYILDTFQRATQKDQASWCIESENFAALRPTDFLSPSSDQNGYCSFVLQDDSNQAVVTAFCNHYKEHSTLPISSSSEEQPDDSVFVANPFWLFVGRNNTSKNMCGRSEHTDEIQHDGTFHYQLGGSKIWNLRPTEELRSKCDEHFDIALLDSYSCTVEEGDVLLINTRLWWHCTEIPRLAESSSNCEGLSISFARDVYFDGRQPKGGAEHMTNIEGGMAAAFIPKGTILLTEADPPGVGRSVDREKANCELVQVYNDDSSDDANDDDEAEVQMALIPFRDIVEGEFFIIFDDPGSDNDF